MQLSEIFSHQPEVRSVIPHTSIHSTRAVGIEVEVENARGAESTRLWNVIRDSSLRDDGREFVLRAPIAGKDLRDAFMELSTLIHSVPSIVVSERCSVHVHVDVRDFTTTQLSNLLTTYVAAESALYMLGGKDRYDNIYCPGITAALEQMSVMRRVLSGDQEQIWRGVHDWCKYTGINLRSVESQGSVEFRAHEGTLDPRRILRWTNILLLMADYATTVEDPSTVLQHAQEGPENFLRRVFAHMADHLLEDGVYYQYHKNNLANVVDLLSSDEYQPARAEGSPSELTSDNLEDVLAVLEQAIRSQNQPTAGGA